MAKDKKTVIAMGDAEHRERLRILEKHLGRDFYLTGRYHNAITDAMREYAVTQKKNQAREEFIQMAAAAEGSLEAAFEIYKIKPEP